MSREKMLSKTQEQIELKVDFFFILLIGKAIYEIFIEKLY